MMYSWSLNSLGPCGGHRKRRDDREIDGTAVVWKVAANSGTLVPGLRSGWRATTNSPPPRRCVRLDVDNGRIIWIDPDFRD